MMEEEMWQLLDEGYTLTWLILDGRYLVTVTHAASRAFCGIGDTREEAWELLQKIKKDRES